MTRMSSVRFVKVGWSWAVVQPWRAPCLLWNMHEIGFAWSRWQCHFNSVHMCERTKKISFQWWFILDWTKVSNHFKTENTHVATKICKHQQKKNPNYLHLWLSCICQLCRHALPSMTKRITIDKQSVPGTRSQQPSDADFSDFVYTSVHPKKILLVEWRFLCFKTVCTC